MTHSDGHSPARQGQREARQGQPADAQELAWRRHLDRITQSTPPERCIDALLLAVLDALESRICLLGRLTREGELQVLRQTHLHEQDATLLPRQLTLTLWRERLSGAMSEHKVFCIDEPGTFGPEAARLERIMAAPLSQADELRGVLLVAGRPVPFNDDDRHMLQVAANHLLPYLENRLLVDTQRDHLKSMEQQLLQSARMEAVGRLAGGIAHDFNNLLTAILGYCNLIEFETDETDPTHGDLVEIRKASDRAAALCKQLLTFSRQSPVEAKPVDLNEVVERLAPMLRRLLVESIELSTDLEPHLGLVYTDPTQLDQVLMNLVVNARDAMPKGGRLDIRTRSEELESVHPERFPGLRVGSYVHLTVRDTGEGMDAATQLRVFEPFFTTKPEGRGTGLGLATVYGIVKQAEGSIWIESALGEGTTFHICLPRHEHGGAKHPKPDSGHFPSPYYGDETVLLVEDEEQVMRLVRSILEKFGYTVLAATRGEDALHLASNHEGPLDAVVTDVVMPGLSGPRLVETLHMSRPGLKVLYMSGYVGDELATHVAPGDRAPLLNKPFSPPDLVRALRKLLDNKH